MPEKFEHFGFENEDIRGGYDKYKGKKGEIHRVGIMFSDPKAIFVGSRTHFKDRYFICKKSICCDKLGASKWRIGCGLIKYKTDKLGNIEKPFSYDLYPWFFSETNYSKLKNLNNEFPLTTHDIKISCTNDDFQHLDITPCNETIWQAKAELKQKILDEAKPIWDYIKTSLANDLSIEEIKDLISGSSGTSTDPTAKLDLDKVLNAI